MNNFTNNHHLVPRSKGGLDTPINLRRTQAKFHDRFHQVFENRTPKEQIDMLLDLNSQVIERKVRHAIRNILEDEAMVYKKGVWIYR